MAGSRSVSVVIATYNRAGLLAETLQAIARQTMPPQEVIIIDDGSTDHTAEVAKGAGGEVRYERIANQGPQAARGHGVTLASGELIAVVDDDDLWLPEKLALQHEAMQRSGCPWVYGDAMAFDDHSGKDLYRFSEVSQPHSGRVRDALLQVNFIPSPTVLIERALLLRVQSRAAALDLRFGEDWLTWLLAADEAPVARVEQVVARYRIHPGGAASRTSVEQRLRDSEQVLDFCATVFDRSARGAIAKARGLARLKAAVGMVSERRPLQGMGFALGALVRRPWLLVEAPLTGARMGRHLLGAKFRTLRQAEAKPPG